MSHNNNLSGDQATENTEYDHNETLNVNKIRNNNDNNDNRGRNSKRRSMRIYNPRDSKFTGANINIPTLKSEAETSVSGENKITTSNSRKNY